MSAHRTHRSDSNAEEIVNALRGCGASVLYLNRAGGRRGGQPDLVVGIDNMTLLVEIKLPKAKLNEDQIRFHAEWKGGPIHVVRSLEDVGTLVNSARLLGESLA